MDRQKVLAIVGPTGIGKTSLSVWLAKQLDGEIISCDSMQVYKKMDIGTAKVTQEEMQGIHHELIDVQNYNEPYNVKVFQEKCRTAIEDVVKRGKFPILCGGTGLYLKAALYDYEFQEENEDIAYTTFLNSKTNEELVAMLKEKDEMALVEIHLFTGRHHQIRVQTANAGFPLYGDTKYNPEFAGTKEWVQIALCAYKLNFAHPITKKQMKFELPTPEHFPVA